MNDRIHPVQQDELHEYVDDRLTPSRRADIERLLARDSGLRERVEAWRAQSAELRAAFAFRAQEPVPEALHVGRLVEMRLRRRGTAWRMVAGLLLAASMGAAGGWYGHTLQRHDDALWLGRQALSAHRVFATDMTRPVELASADQASLMRWISARLGHPIEVPDLRPLGYRFIGGRLLAAVGGPAAMLLYDAPDGSRISVYVQPMHGAPVTPMRPVEDRAVGGYVWINSQIGYSVMSAGDFSDTAQSTIHRLANKVRDDMKIAG